MEDTTKTLTQHDANALMHNAGLDRYDHRTREAVATGHETHTHPGRYLLQEAVQKMAEALQGWIHGQNGPGRKSLARKYLLMIDTEVVAFITAQVVLDQISQDQSYLTTANAVSCALEDEARFARFRKDFPAEWRDVMRAVDGRPTSKIRKRLQLASRKAELDWEPWSRQTKNTVGTVCIELLVQSTGLVEVKNVPIAKMNGSMRKRGAYAVKAMICTTDETLKWLEQSHEQHRIRFPFYLPTVTEPNAWVGPQDGGYDSNVFTRWPLFRVKRRMLSQLTYEDVPQVYDAVNAIQRVPYIVNDNVFAVFDELWANGGGIAGLPSRELHPLPEKPENYLTCEDAKRMWKREAGFVHDSNSRLRGNRTMVGKIHFVARHFAHQPFYFPHKTDFRGRIYPIPSFLNPQGDDLSKGLLMFEESKPVDTPAARAWLARHGANCWGLDKKSFAEREQWVTDNESMILACSGDPFGRSQWTEASEPWQFLAFCFEWDELLQAERAGAVYSSRLPVAMDGTNNGLQLFSLLLRDPVGAAATNVSPSDRPADIYQDVADRVTAMLEADADGSVEEVTTNSKRGTTTFRVADMARAWLAFCNGRLPRAATKRSVMVVPYSGTLYACREYVEGWYVEQLYERKLERDRPFAQTHTYTRYLSHLIWRAIHEVVVGARAGMAWLQALAHQMTEAKKPLRWVSPSGMIVEQAVMVTKIKEVKTQVGETVRYRSTQVETAKLSHRGQANGVSPNFIHSLDAAVLTKTVNRCVAEGIHSFAMVHDSYATHAADADKMAGIIRSTVAEMFSRDLLKEFAEQIAGQLGVSVTTLPPVPAYGTLNPACVLDSKYFFG